MATLRILIDGQERHCQPFNPDNAHHTAMVLMETADKFRAAGRSVALVDHGKVVVMCPFSTMGRNMKKPLPPLVPEAELDAAAKALREMGYDDVDAESAAITALEAAQQARKEKSK